MPDDRLLHPRLRMSAKVSSLTDFEYRVWTDYLLIADNFGVLPDSPVMLRAGNLALAARPESEIRHALDNLVTIGLLLRFTHQEQSYLCDPSWQDFQKIRYPKASYYPVPTADIFPKLSENTRALFRDFHRGFAKKKGMLGRPGYRLTAMANGSQSSSCSSGGESERGDAVALSAVAPSGFDRFWVQYPKKVGKEAARRAWEGKHLEPKTEAILAGLERTRPYLLREEGRYIPNPATWLNAGRWEDEPPAPAVFGAGKTSGNLEAARRFLERGPA